MYGRVVVYCRPEKSDPYNTRLTVGLNRVEYLGYCATPTVYLTMVKIILNSIASTPNSKFMTIVVKYFYLDTLMARSEYMRIKLRDLPKSLV